MNVREFRPLHRLFAAAAALALLVLSGCVAYPAYPGPGYAPAPAYVSAPPVVVGFGWGGGWGHGCCWGGGHWR